jgi:hypothetical protein
MHKRLALLATAVVCAIAVQSRAQPAEEFQKLTGAQIQARLAGMEITDEVHWADVFAANGTLTSYSMGRKSNGTWRVQKDEVCIDRGKDDGGCYEVWLAGKKVELRREGSTLPREAFCNARAPVDDRTMYPA